MSSFNSSLNPNVVKTDLDGEFYQEFEMEKKPGLATVDTEDIFHQDTVDNAAVQWEVFKGVGYWDERDEEEDVANGTPRSSNKITFSVANFAKSVDIPKNFFNDNMHGVYSKMIKDMATTGKLTKEKKGFEIFRNAFTTTLTADGVALCSDSHLTIGGNTVDNALTSALADTSLNDAITMLGEQKGQDGTIRGCVPNALLVPAKLFKKACELVDSQLTAETGNNAINVYSSKYSINVYQSPFLGAAAGGSDTAWFLLSKNHGIYRWVRQGVATDLVDYKFQRNNTYIYKAEYREAYGAVDYVGIVGSTGAA